MPNELKQLLGGARLSLAQVSLLTGIGVSQLKKASAGTYTLTPKERDLVAMMANADRMRWLRVDGALLPETVELLASMKPKYASRFLDEIERVWARKAAAQA